MTSSLTTHPACDSFLQLEIGAPIILFPLRGNDSSNSHRLLQDSRERWQQLQPLLASGTQEICSSTHAWASSFSLRAWKPDSVYQFSFSTFVASLNNILIFAHTLAIYLLWFCPKKKISPGFLKAPHYPESPFVGSEQSTISNIPFRQCRSKRTI